MDVEALADELEPFVDRHGMSEVLAGLAVLAFFKADHVEDTWNDVGLARAWKRVASKISRTSQAVAKEKL